MTVFLKFHLWLVFSNKTTIENLDAQNKGKKSNVSLTFNFIV